MDYTTKAQVQDYMQTDIDASLDTRIAQYITAMSEYADEVAGYPIYRDETTAKKYDGDGTDEIMIEPVHTITEVTLGEETITPTKWPYNRDIKRMLLLDGEYFTKGLANIEVTGTHCLETALPKKVEWAVTVLVAGIVNHLKNQDEGVRSEKIGEYQVTYIDKGQRSDFKMALDILKRYRTLAF